jgi:cell shape-determining protein MreD
MLGALLGACLLPALLVIGLIVLVESVTGFALLAVVSAVGTFGGEWMPWLLGILLLLVGLAAEAGAFLGFLLGTLLDLLLRPTRPPAASIE